jgi:hypothetical protein
MKKFLAILSLAVPLACAAPLAAHAATTAPASKCNKFKPSKDCGTAVIVTAYSGQFRVPVFQTHLVLKGQASIATHGVQIFAQRAVASHAPLHAVVFRVFAVGHMPILSLVSHARLYRYAMARGTWTSVPTVTTAGIYAAVTS